MNPTPYTEHPPTPALTPYVECYWTVRGAVAARQRSRVLPDGCMDVLFNLGDFPLRDGEPEHRLRSFVVGAMPTAAVFDLVGRVDMLGVRFRPGAAPAFIAAPAHAMTATVAPLGALWGDASRRLEERMAACRDTAARIGLLERALLRRLGTGAGRDPGVCRAVSLIRRSAGSASVGRLADAVGWSERHLRRRFRETTGLTPKQASRVARFQRAVTLLTAVPEPDCGRVALRAGYYDQPHFTHEFRDLAGLTPTAWLRERGVRSVQGDAGAAG